MKTNWPIKKLGEVCNVVIGGTPRRGIGEYWDDGDLPWVSIADLSRNGREISVTKEMITEIGARESNVKLLNKGTLLFSFKLSIGKVAFAGVDLYTNEAIAGLRIRDGKELDKEFLFYFLQQLDFRGAQKAVKGATLNKAKMNVLEIPLPPIEEQRKIVARIEKQFAKIDEAVRLRAESQEATAQLLPSALHEIFSTAESKGWKEVELSSILREIRTGPFGSTLHKSDYVSSGIPVVNPQNLKDGKIIPLGKTMISAETRERLKQFALQRGDIVMARRGEMGRCAVVTENEAGWLCGTGSAILRFQNAMPEYMTIMLSSAKVRRFLEGASVGTTMSNLNQAILKKIKIPLPPLAEQKEIVNKLDALSGKVRELQALQSAQATNLKALKQSILHEAFAL